MNNNIWNQPNIWSISIRRRVHFHSPGRAVYLPTQLSLLVFPCAPHNSAHNRLPQVCTSESHWSEDNHLSWSFNSTITWPSCYLVDSWEQRSLWWMFKLWVCFRCKASQPVSPAAFVFTICKSNNLNKYVCCLTYISIALYENSTLFVL